MMIRGGKVGEDLLRQATQAALRAAKPELLLIFRRYAADYGVCRAEQLALRRKLRVNSAF
jgi:hypothetical protein